jgi:hypothetical protein
MRDIRGRTLIDSPDVLSGLEAAKLVVEVAIATPAWPGTYEEGLLKDYVMGVGYR